MKVDKITDSHKYHEYKIFKKTRYEKREQFRSKMVMWSYLGPLERALKYIQNYIIMAILCTICTFLAAYLCIGCAWWKFGLIAAAPYLLQLFMSLIKRFLLSLHFILEIYDYIYDRFNRKNSGIER